MNTADEARGDASSGGDSGERAREPAPESPALSAGWILRAAALAASVAGLVGVIVAPGVRGNASESVVVALDWLAAALAYFLVFGLVALGIIAGLALLPEREIPSPVRVALLAAAGIVVILAAMGMRDRIPPPSNVVISAATAIAAVASASVAVRAPHTRAASGVLLILAFAAMARLAAWILATRAGEAASVQMFATSRGFATAGVLLEAGGQLIAVTWLGARSRAAGQLGAFAALVGAFVVTWGVAQGVHSGAALWQAIAHTALADAPGVPQPYGLDALATFLVPASLLLALAVAAQPNQPVALLAAMALALVSRGAFDAPLRALCAIAAAQWAALACLDQRSMWRTLLAERANRLAGE
jgi:hypothetical protein